MTMREVDWRIRSIVDRSNLERVFTAQLHGCEVDAPKVKKETKKMTEINNNQEKAMEAAIKQAKIRKARQYGK